ncbi:general substrate transporter [Geopyxis carbonaria]|nr:general substrate transporter [Geopyxis carbonaria]
MSDYDSKKLEADAMHVESPSLKNNVDNHEALDSIEDTKSGKFSWLIAVTAAIGGFLFGYDTGIIAAVLVSIGTALDNKELAVHEKELITALCSGGAFVGAILAGSTADRYGRKLAIYVACVLFTVGAVIQAAAYGMVQMAVGRFVVGLGVGSAAMIVPLYISEIAPAKYRGRMIALNNVCITGGQVVSYAVGAGFASMNHGWRYDVGLGGVPSIILACLLPLLPESPRQLIWHGKSEEATNVITRIYPNATQEQITQKIQLIEFHVEEAKALTAGKSTYWLFKQLHTVPGNLRALIAACGLMAISQFSGFNTLMYYSATLFAMVGFDNPTAVGLVVAGTNFICTIINGALVDKIGRRRILLCTIPGMALGLAVVAIAFHWIPVDSELSIKTGQLQGTSWAGILVLCFIIVFVACYSSGVGNTAWMGNEFLPMEVRALGTMMITCTCWGSNIIVSSTFLTMMKSLSPSGAFGFYAALCAIGFIAIFFCYPEVAGLSLEDIREIFNHGFGVKYARNLRKERAITDKTARQA